MKTHDLLDKLRPDHNIEEPPDWASDSHAFYREETPYCPECGDTVVLEETIIGMGMSHDDHVFEERLLCHACDKMYRLTTRRQYDGIIFQGSRLTWR